MVSKYWPQARGASVRILPLHHDFPKTLATEYSSQPSCWRDAGKKMKRLREVTGTWLKPSRETAWPQQKFLEIKSDKDIDKLSMEQRRTAIAHFEADCLHKNQKPPGDSRTYSHQVDMIYRIATAAPPGVPSKECHLRNLVDSTLHCLSQVYNAYKHSDPNVAREAKAAFANIVEKNIALINEEEDVQPHITIEEYASFLIHS
ncbi:hypothetical protein PCANC_14623 [Puccinia coronata f. sp. avenae]|uniref:Uncharacterized protein n=1 Tax=Puccinia coronata f. sp. avenae TaxID=200324 RepID=A0A2N5SV62_9BASI|nr:hypothetical protein PCANC_14623 [Puccinia coronata f. sp. avenae]